MGWRGNWEFSGGIGSGPGSGLRRTEAFRDQIPLLLAELGARSLIDAGCGDFNWIKEIRLSLDWYLGVEIVPELAARNREAYGDGSRSFVHGNIARDELPRADVILCRDCLVHFSFEDLASTLRNFKKSGSVSWSWLFGQLGSEVKVYSGC